jgi:hypothetical protein
MASAGRHRRAYAAPLTGTRVTIMRQEAARGKPATAKKKARGYAPAGLASL